MVNNLKEELFCIFCVNCYILPPYQISLAQSKLFIIGYKNLKPNFVLPPFVAIYYVNMVVEKSFKLPHSLLPLRILWTDKNGHKNTVVIYFVF